MRLRRPRRAVVCALALSLAPGAALAASTAETTIEVAPRVEVAAPAVSPATFPGVTRVREGERLPRGRVVVGSDVRITRGAEPAFAAMRMTCPKGKTWRSGTSDVTSASACWTAAPAASAPVLVMATFSTSAVRVGEVAAGTVYALCR